MQPNYFSIRFTLKWKGCINMRYAIQVILGLLGFITIMLCVFFLWPYSNEMAIMHAEVSYLRLPVLFGLYATAVPFLYALYAAAQIVRSSDDFKTLSYYLRHIQYCAAVILLLYLGGLFMLIEANAANPAVGLIGIIVIIVCLLIFMTCYHFRYTWKKRGIFSSNAIIASINGAPYF